MKARGMSFTGSPMEMRQRSARPRASARRGGAGACARVLDARPRLAATWTPRRVGGLCSECIGNDERAFTQSTEIGRDPSLMRLLQPILGTEIGRAAFMRPSRFVCSVRLPRCSCALASFSTHSSENTTRSCRSWLALCGDFSYKKIFCLEQVRMYFALLSRCREADPARGDFYENPPTLSARCRREPEEHRGGSRPR